MPTPRRRHALLLLATLLVTGAAAQPNESQERSNGGGGRAPGETQPPSFSAPMVVLLVALVATFFVVGFFSIYIRQCGRAGRSTGPGAIPAAALFALSQQEQQQQNRQRGLDPAVIASFPTMTYAEARELRDGGKDDDAVLECAVCLSEFDDQEELRLLPKCSHAFHPDCIGEWLAGHVTCPVCRCSLDPDEPAAGAETNGSGEVPAEEQREVAIDVNREGGEEERRREALELERIGNQRRAVRSSRSFSRAHSTGHSLSTRLDGDLERFTLRLPEHVRRGMVLAAGEESLLRRTGAREGRGAGAARSARIGRSDRWPSFIARTFSSRVPFWGASRRASGDAEAPGVPPGSTTVRTMRDQKTTAAAADGSVGSAKGSVRFDCLGGGGGGVSGGRVGAVAGDSEEEDEEKAIVRQA